MVGQIAKALSEAAGHPVATWRTQRGYDIESGSYVTRAQLTSDKGTHFDFAVTEAQLSLTHEEFGAYLIKEYPLAFTPLAFTPLVDPKKEAQARLHEAWRKLDEAHEEVATALYKMTKFT